MRHSNGLLVAHAFQIGGPAAVYIRICYNAEIRAASQKGRDVSIIWTIVIGFIAGIIAKFLIPGPNEPSGFILTTILGIVGAFVATFLGQAVGWYGPGEAAGLIGAVVGAVIILVIWGMIAARRA
jgi:uncharacterized membrane protein YeaQ/YmgE (transglycosylase-associated protein family)